MPQQFALSPYHSVPFDHSSCTNISSAQHCQRERTCEGVHSGTSSIYAHTQTPASWTPLGQYYWNCGANPTTPLPEGLQFVGCGGF